MTRPKSVSVTARIALRTVQSSSLHVSSTSGTLMCGEASSESTSWASACFEPQCR